MSDKITWNEAKERWDLADYELIDCLKQGLQPRSKNTGNFYDCPREFHLGYHAERRVSELNDQIQKRTNELIDSGTDPYLTHSDPDICNLQNERSTHKRALDAITNEDPYFRSWKYFTFIRDEEKAKELISKLRDHVEFKLRDIEDFETKHRKEIKATHQKVFPCEPGTEWENIKITLVSETTVRIETPQGRSTFSYHDLKMADLRTREKKPNMLWALLKIFAQCQGYLTPTRDEYDSKFPDTAKRLNKHLQALFNIPESIFTSHYKSTDRYKPEKDRNKPAKGYRTKIYFSDQTQVIQ